MSASSHILLMRKNRHLAKVCFNQKCVFFYHRYRSTWWSLLTFFLIEKETDTCTKARQMIRDDFLCRFLFLRGSQFYYPMKVSHIINDFLYRAKNWIFTLFYIHYRLVKYNCCSDVGTILNHKSDPFLWSKKRAYRTGQSHVINNTTAAYVCIYTSKNETLIQRCKFFCKSNCLTTNILLLFFLFIEEEKKTQRIWIFSHRFSYIIKFSWSKKRKTKIKRSIFKWIYGKTSVNFNHKMKLRLKFNIRFL